MSRIPILRLAATAVAAALAVSVAGCSGGAAPASSADPDAPVAVAISLTSASLPFSEEIRRGAEAAAADLDVELEVTGPPLIDPPTAIAQIEGAIATGVDGVAIADEPAALWVRALRDAQERTGGNLVTFNTIPAAETPVETYVGIKAAEYGARLAEELVSAAGAGEKTTGTVLVGICFAGSEPLAATTEALVATLEELLPNADILPPFDSKLAPADNAVAWEQQIGANPGTVLTVGVCDQDAESMLRARQSTGADFGIGAVTSTPNVLAGIEDGSVSVAVLQNWYVVGYTVIRLLAEAARAGGTPQAGWIDTGVTVVTADNAADIAARDADAAGEAQFYAPLIEELWGDLSAATRPLAEAQQ